MEPQRTDNCESKSNHAKKLKPTLDKVIRALTKELPLNRYTQMAVSTAESVLGLAVVLSPTIFDDFYKQISINHYFILQMGGFSLYFHGLMRENFFGSIAKKFFEKNTEYWLRYYNDEDISVIVNKLQQEVSQLDNISVNSKRVGVYFDDDEPEYFGDMKECKRIKRVGEEIWSIKQGHIKTRCGDILKQKNPFTEKRNITPEQAIDFVQEHLHKSPINKSKVYYDSQRIWKSKKIKFYIMPNEFYQYVGYWPNERGYIIEIKGTQSRI